MVCARCSSVIDEGPATGGSCNGGGDGEEVCIFVSDGAVGDRTWNKRDGSKVAGENKDYERYLISIEDLWDKEHGTMRVATHAMRWYTKRQSVRLMINGTRIRRETIPQA